MKAKESELRKSGMDIVGDIPWGTHICQFYQTREDLLDVLVPYFKAGLENNEFCVWVTSEPVKVEDAKSSLKKVIKNLDDYIAKGQIEILDSSQWYTKSGKFEADKVLRGWVEKEAQALKMGFDGLRLTGNTSWLEKNDWIRFADYEATINNVIGKYRMIAICSYSLDKCNAVEIIEVVNNHQFALIKKEGEWLILKSSERKKAEEMLRESEARYKTLFTGAPEGILVADVQTKQFRYANPAICRMFGYTEEELLRIDMANLHPKESLSHVLAEFELQVQGKKTFSPDIPCLRKDGTLFYANISGIKIVLDSHKCNAGFFTDITERKKAEEQISTLSKLPSENPSPILRATKGGKILYANPAAMANLDFCKCETGEYMPSQWKRWIKETFKQIGGKVKDVEVECGDRIFSFEIVPIADRGYANLYGRDITERRQAEGSLRASEERYSAIFHSAAEGILIAENKTRKFMYANPAVCQMLGYAEEEIKQMRVDDIHPKTDLDRVVSEFTALARGKKTLTQDIPILCLRKDRAIIYANVVATRAEIDGIDCCVGLFSDTTEQKRSRENIVHAAKEWRETFDSISDMISIHDLSYRITRVNRAFASAFGMKPQEVIGRTCCELFHEMGKQPQQCPGKEVLDRGEPVSVKLFEPRMGRCLEITVTPLRDDNDKIRGFVHIAKDITEREKAEEHALHAEKLAVVGELASGVAHEIRNPLANISATAQYCLGKYEMDNAMRKHMDVIVRNSESANRIIKDLLDFARPHKASFRMCSVKEMIKNTCELIKPRCAANRVRVRRRLARRLPSVLMDLERMEQALMNFMLNAVDAMPRGGKLIVTAESAPDKSEIVICITDTGKGIPGDELPKIFNPFFSTKRDGVGLGLSITHQIIDQHKGAIDVKSEVGSGTTVTVRLPVTHTHTHTHN